MIANIHHHRVHWGPLAGVGAIVGFSAALISGVLALFVGTLLDAVNVWWAFPAAIASIPLGDAAVSDGYSTAVVTTGIGLHLTFGATFGALFALLVGWFDIEGPVPAAIAGLCFGVAIFGFAYGFVAYHAFAAYSDVPVVVALTQHIAFGLLAGGILGGWPEQFDEDHEQTDGRMAYSGTYDPGAVSRKRH